MTEQQLRPTVMATQHVVASGHYLSAQTGFQILEAGGNAIDAGVATGLATCVLESEFVGFSGVVAHRPVPAGSLCVHAAQVAAPAACARDAPAASRASDMACAKRRCPALMLRIFCFDRGQV